jgi:hypothetical protein
MCVQNGYLINIGMLYVDYQHYYRVKALLHLRYIHTYIYSYCNEMHATTVTTVFFNTVYVIIYTCTAYATLLKHINIGMHAIDNCTNTAVSFIISSMYRLLLLHYTTGVICSESDSVACIL